MPVAAILLAAGASRRLGRPKQLIEIDGETLLGRAARLAIESGASPVFVVLGAHAHEIRSAVRLDAATVVINERWEQGIATSLRAGMVAIDANASGVLTLACDQPRLTASHLRNLLAAFEAHGATVIAASVYSGARGIPAVFPRSVFLRLLSLEGDRGARSIIADPANKIVEVAFEGGEIDIDSPPDLALLG